MRGKGLSFRTIAERVGISVSMAHGDYRAAIRDVYLHSTEELVATQHQRLERLYSAYVDEAVDGDKGSAEICLKVNDQVAKLFGLNSAVKLDVQGTAATDFAKMLETLRGGK